ncbi:hypothetical protein SAMN04488031_12533 [Roseovarius indicus]|nr:hypothetical protein SAMN04488031_12533 [Roseovarius indicus]
MPCLPIVRLRQAGPGVKMSQMRLGDAVRLHNETDHRVGKHLLEEEIRQGITGQLVPRACVVEVGKGNSQDSLQSRMRCPGMKLHQDGGFPSFGVHLIRGRRQFRFNLVLARRKRFSKAWNGERSGENRDSLTRQIFHWRCPFACFFCCYGWSAPHLSIRCVARGRLKMSWISLVCPCRQVWTRSPWQES